MSQTSTQASHVQGTDTPALLDYTIGEALTRAAEHYGDHEALVSLHQNIRLSYNQLNERAESIATGLLNLGLEPGERVGIWAPTCVEWTLTQYATAKAGLILVNINPAYRLYELEYALNKVGCRALVLAEQFKTSEYFKLIRTLAPELEICEPGKLKAAKLPALEMVIGFS